MPKVSVVIPNYNHERFLRQRVESVLVQTYRDFEVVLMDDCSTDGSRAILEKYASDRRVRLDFNGKNSGSSFKQWNKGVGLATGEYVWIAESDDYADSRLLERLTAAMEAGDRMVFAYCRSWKVLEGERLGGFLDPYLPGPHLYRWRSDYRANGYEECRDFLVRDNTVPNASAVLFKRAAYLQAGGADERMRLCGDWKLWAGLALLGNVAYVSEPLNYFRFHEGSVRSKTRRTSLDIAEILEVTRWIKEKTQPPDSVIEKVCEGKADYWVRAVLSPHTPMDVRRRILRHVWAIDPTPVRRAVRPAMLSIKLKFLRHWRGGRPLGEGDSQ